MLLAEYLTNEESQLEIGLATAEGPANLAAASQIDSPALAALAAQSAYADQQLVGSNYWDPAKALGQNLVDGATEGNRFKSKLEEMSLKSVRFYEICKSWKLRKPFHYHRESIR